MAKFNLFIDDQWDDPNTIDRVRPPAGYICAASSAQAIQLVEELGMPESLMLDFDLSGEGKASTFLKWLYTKYPDGPVPEYCIHSKNGPGSEWMRSYLESWKRSLSF